MDKSKLPTIRAKVVLLNGSTVDAYAVNPGECFGRRMVLSFDEWDVLVVVEADTLEDAIAVIADSDDYLYLVEFADPDDEDGCGDDECPFDLTKVMEEEYSSVEYYLDLSDDPKVIKELADWCREYAKHHAT